jgi:hypothetical protein
VGFRHGFVSIPVHRGKSVLENSSVPSGRAPDFTDSSGAERAGLLSNAPFGV